MSITYLHLRPIEYTNDTLFKESAENSSVADPEISLITYEMSESERGLFRFFVAYSIKPVEHG